MSAPVPLPYETVCEEILPGLERISGDTPRKLARSRPWRNPCARCETSCTWFMGIGNGICLDSKPMRACTSENGRYDYLQHDMRRTMPAVGRIKISRQAGSLARRADVDVFHRTINTMETSANNVLLTTTHTSERMGRSVREEVPT